MRYFNDRYAGLVQCLGHCPDLLCRKLVTHGVRAIAQTAIGNAGSLQIVHAAASFKSRWAIISPTRRAAAVMISRLPAYFGKKSPAPSTSSSITTTGFLPQGVSCRSNTGGFLR